MRGALRKGGVVVLISSGPDCILGAVDLYKESYADKIVLVRNLIGGFGQLWEKHELRKTYVVFRGR